MKDVVIAFDVDGVIYGDQKTDGAHRAVVGQGLNLKAIHLMETLSTFKNTRVIVWSGGGKDYAETIVRKFGLERFVDACVGKNTDIHVDIAFDDEADMELADKNIIFS